MLRIRPRAERVSTVDGPLIPSRGGKSRSKPVAVSEQRALCHSAVWACRRLRANLISTFPVDVYRKVNDIQIEVPKPAVLSQPGGPGLRNRWIPWAHASQWELDGSGNAIGLIVEWSRNLPARVELFPSSCCTVILRKGMTEPRYRIDGKEYPADKVWHEVQYPVAGLPVGLSPIAYAAWDISEGLSMQEFALDWFDGAGVPRARLKQLQRRVDSKEAGVMKDRYNASVHTGDLFVHGSDWEFNLMRAEAMGTEWLEGRRFNVPSICRYFDVPADLIEAAISAPGSIVYQTALQRNLQFLIMSLGPAIIRREDAWSAGLLSAPRFVKLNTDALLRMDPESRDKVISAQVKDKRLTVSEARALYDLAPLTEEQIAEIERLQGAARVATPEPAQRAALPWEPVSPYSAAPFIDSEVAR